MIPRLKRGFADALLQLEEILRDGRAAFRIERPAMLDPASIEFQRAFAYDRNEHATAAMLSRQPEP